MNRLGDLTSKQTEVLDLVVLGWSTKKICAELAIAPKTFTRHLGDIYESAFRGEDHSDHHKRSYLIYAYWQERGMCPHRTESPQDEEDLACHLCGCNKTMACVSVGGTPCTMLGLTAGRGMICSLCEFLDQKPVAGRIKRLRMLRLDPFFMAGPPLPDIQKWWEAKRKAVAAR